MKTTFNTPAGICRFCGCSDFDPCEAGCWWADRTFRLCSTCVPAARAEGKQLKTLRRVGYALNAPWLRAYHRGFIVGWFAVTARSPSGRNPYAHGRVREAWTLGQRAAAAGRQAYESTCGPITEVPRLAVLAPHAGSARGRRRLVGGRGHGARDRRVWSHA